MTVDILKQMGFAANNNKTKKNNTMKYYLQSLANRLSEGRRYNALLFRIKNELKKLNYNRIGKEDKERLSILVSIMSNSDDRFLIKQLLDNETFLVEVVYGGKGKKNGRTSSKAL